MPRWRTSKGGQQYLELSEEDAASGIAEQRAWLAETPTTPEGWVEDAEKLAALHREHGIGDLFWEFPEFDNWYAWLEYQARKYKMHRTTVEVGRKLPSRVSQAGDVDLPSLARASRITVKTVKIHLKKLQDLGVDFSRLREWPHPVRSSPMD